jgi:hypothetical protein
VPPLFSQPLSQISVIGKAEFQSSELISKEVRDANGDVCAGLIIATDLDGLKFDSYNGVVKMNADKPGRYFLFLSPDERVVTAYKTGFKPLKIILSEYGIAKMESGNVWQLNVTGEKKLEIVPVTILIEPSDATILIDGQNKGSDKTQEVALGKHKLQVEKEGFKTYSQTIEVSSKNVLFNAKLMEVELQTVTITSVPECAKIYVDNTDKGETNKQTFLYPNSYALTLSKSGYLDVQEKIEVKEKVPNKFSYTLIKNVGTLNLSVTPSDAKILINKEDYSGKAAIDLGPGRYKIEVSKTGYNAASEVIDVVLSKRIDKTFVLVPKTGELQFTVTPIDAKVILKQNGITVQQWEGAKIINKLQVGEYDLEAISSGYNPAQKRILIEEGKAITKDIILSKVVGGKRASSGSTIDKITYEERSHSAQNFNLLAYYPLDGDFNDRSGHNIECTGYGPIDWTTDRNGNKNHAMMLDGFNTYFLINDISSELNFDVQRQPFSISLWVQLKTGSSSNIDQTILIDRGTSNNSPCSYAIVYRSSERKFFLNCWTGRKDILVWSNSRSFIGNWTHIVMVNNCQDIKMYLNNKLESVQPIPPGFGSTLNQDKLRCVGRTMPNLGATNHVNGALDEIRIYNKALLEEEISTLYNINK